MTGVEPVINTWQFCHWCRHLKVGCGVGNYILLFIRCNYLEPDAVSSPDNEPSSLRRNSRPHRWGDWDGPWKPVSQEECKVCVLKTACKPTIPEFTPPTQNHGPVTFSAFRTLWPISGHTSISIFFPPCPYPCLHTFLHSILHGEKSSQMESLRNCTCNKKLDSFAL